ncbi:hypothetical protein F4778DRAFT_778622 [Xylariomycetidae sp. FL2044]|nr:hypothetical protein F4778DRAFT_778622 [Xylariomycetidae sp. FL2044]
MSESDSEGLLTHEQKSTFPADLVPWHSFPSVVIATLSLPNILTLAWIILAPPPGGSRGGKAGVAHLAREAPTLLNVSFYANDSPWRKHDSSEAAQADIDPARHTFVNRPDLGTVGLPRAAGIRARDALRQHAAAKPLLQPGRNQVAHCRPPPYCVPAELEEWGVLHIGK